MQFAYQKCFGHHGPQADTQLVHLEPRNPLGAQQSKLCLLTQQRPECEIAHLSPQWHDTAMASSTKRSIIWFRRDLRIGDNPALNAAIEAGEEVVPVFILDPKLIKSGGSKRLAYLGQSLRELDKSLNKNLQVIAGDQIETLKELQKKYNADSVHISAEYEPYGAARDEKVEAAGINLVRTGSPYAVAPGRVRKPSDDTPYKVYTPFYRGWLQHGWRAPAPTPKEIPTVKADANSRNFPDWQLPEGVELR